MYKHFSWTYCQGTFSPSFVYVAPRQQIIVEGSLFYLHQSLRVPIRLKLG